MATTMKDSDTQVTFEDQQKINRFARTNAKLMDLKEELTSKEKELENLTDAEDELMMAEGEDEHVPYPLIYIAKIGEVLVEMTSEEAQAALEAAKEVCQGEITALKSRADGFKQTLSELKTQLYAKFGTNINLDLDDES
ncbi:prefoldin subunit 4 [Plakobranchus ocellatus]|uniref:Prefoldin subunit 4 n=1 Tax=Plakobranchus ocellatus TaxID=259542 RepID=A0AAV4D3H7_9GAST|nr:prefoldin subunit 4 [Plakobranchus ocellatus]